MPITLPNLDDLQFADLVEEARALIPSSAPEWTNHNPSDPGIMLVELFVYLTEMLIYRLNRVTDANVCTFLKFIDGVERRPCPGLDLDAEVSNVLLALDEKYRAVTRQDFENLAREAAPQVARALCVPKRILDVDETATVFLYDTEFVDLSLQARMETGASFALVRAPGQFLYVGLPTDRPAIQFRLDGKGVGYKLVFESHVEAGWDVLTAGMDYLTDSTSNWSADGTVEFIPAGWTASEVNGVTKYWLRVSTSQTPTQPTTAFQLGVREAEHVSLVVVPSEAPFDQVLLYDRTYTSLTRRTGAEDWRPFTLLTDAGQYLYLGSAETFGGIKFRLAAAGANYELSFEYFNGASWVALTAADNALNDGTANLTSDGSVSFDVAAGLWKQAEVGGFSLYWVRVSTGTRPAPPASALEIVHDSLSPSNLTAAVAAYLEPRRLLATRLHVTEPSYVSIGVRLRLFLEPDAVAEEVYGDAIAALQEFFHPIYGGQDEAGWPFGRDVYVSEIYRLLDAVAGVDFVTQALDAQAQPLTEINVADAARRIMSPDSAAELVGVKLFVDELPSFNIGMSSIVTVYQQKG